MRNRTKLPAVFLAAVMAVMYLPILMVVIYSFNASKLTAIWGGFSLDWYGKLFQDREIREALVNSLVVGGLSCLAAAVIGTLGALGNSRLRLRSKGAVEYIATLPIICLLYTSKAGIPYLVYPYVDASLRTEEYYRALPAILKDLAAQCLSLIHI